MPTATPYTANLAPAEMRRHVWRRRYMVIYSLTWNVAQDIGPTTKISTRPNIRFIRFQIRCQLVVSRAGTIQ